MNAGAIRLRWVLLGAVLPWLAGVPLATADLDRMIPVPPDQPIPASDFTRPQAFSDPEMNHAGTALAAVIIGKDRRKEALLYDIPTARTLPVVSGAAVTGSQWITDDELCLYENITVILPNGSYLRPSSEYLDWRQIDWKNQRVSNNRVHFFGVRPPGSIYPDVYWQPPAELLWPKDPPGQRVRAVAERLTGLPSAVEMQQDGERRIYRCTDGRWIPCPIDPERIHLLGSGEKAGEVVVSALLDHLAPPAVRRMDLATGKLGDVLGSDKDYEASGLVYSADGRRVVGITFAGLYPHTLWIDRQYRAEQQIVQHQVKGADNLLLQADASGKRLLVESISDRQPPVYYLADLQKRAFQLLKASAPWIDPRRTHRVVAIRYKTRDGVTLDGTLLVPPGASRLQPVPLLVLLTGDSQAQSVQWGWLYLAQLFGQWGYAVFIPANRAASGLSWQVPEEQWWDFGVLQRDYEEGITYLLHSGIIDPHLVGVVGMGTGTAQALTLAIDRPDLVRCALVYPGICDVVRYVHDHPQQSLWLDEAIHRLGEPEDRPAAYAPLNPLRRITQLKVPVCLIDTAYFVSEHDMQFPELDNALETNHLAHVDIREKWTLDADETAADTDRLYGRVHQYLSNVLPPNAAAGNEKRSAAPAGG